VLFGLGGIAHFESRTDNDATDGIILGYFDQLNLADRAASGAHHLAGGVGFHHFADCLWLYEQ
jgi:hypothetical protein